jgi:hypothetical protein
MTRARARELNYQVNSFLAFHKLSSMNGVLLNSCDAFLILRNMGHEPDWRESKHDLVGKLLKSTFRWIQPQDEIPKELSRIAKMTFSLSVLG